MDFQRVLSLSTHLETHARVPPAPLLWRDHFDSASRQDLWQRGFDDFERFAKARESWLRERLKLPGGLPSDDTFRRIFTAINPDKFCECFASLAERSAASSSPSTAKTFGTVSTTRIPAPAYTSSARGLLTTN